MNFLAKKLFFAFGITLIAQLNAVTIKNISQEDIIAIAMTPDASKASRYRTLYELRVPASPSSKSKKAPAIELDDKRGGVVSRVVIWSANDASNLSNPKKNMLGSCDNLRKDSEIIVKTDDKLKKTVAIFPEEIVAANKANVAAVQKPFISGGGAPKTKMPPMRRPK